MGGTSGGRGGGDAMWRWEMGRVFFARWMYVQRWRVGWSECWRRYGDGVWRHACLSMV